MKNFKIYSLLAPLLVILNFNCFAQSYHRAIKFNYGVFLYNDQNSQTIKEPFATPFSLGLQYQSNLSKTLTNSIGANVYKWNNGNQKNESFSFQDIIFIRNNAKLFNRLKPQFGFGLGFEERKSSILNQITYQQLVFVPVNVGFQTDLTEQLAIGIFGEFRYGFNLQNFNFNKGSILPNNTAGISLAFRFGRVKENNNFQAVNWNADPSQIITLDLLINYLDSNQNNKVQVIGSPFIKERINNNLVENKIDTIKALKNSINNTAKITLSKKERRGSLEKRVTEQDKLNQILITEKSNFKLSDFITNQSNSSSDTVIFKMLNNQKTLPKNKVEIITDTVYRFNKVVQQESESVRFYQPEITYQKTPYRNDKYINISDSGYTNKNAVKDAVDISIMSSQLAQLLDLQKETNRLLQNQQNYIGDDSLKVNNKSNQTDSMRRKIAFLELKIKGIDSLMRLTALQDPKKLDLPIKDSLITVKVNQKVKPETNNQIDFKEEYKKSDYADVKAIITYPINQSEINDIQRTLILNEVIKHYQNDGTYDIILEAYTDASGSVAYNKQLSDIRINKVVNFLKSYGVNSNDVLIKNFGNTKAKQDVNKEERKIVVKVLKQQN